MPKIKFLGYRGWPNTIGSFCGVWTKGEIKEISEKDAEFLLEHHSSSFKKVE